MNIKEAIVGTLVTVIIGGTAYTVSQEDIVNNFAEDTGLTQEQAEEYVNSIEEDDLASFDEIGLSYIQDGEETLQSLSEIDCENYTYEFESASLSCDLAKEQLTKLANDSISLGEAYRSLDTESATEEDISITIGFIDVVNEDYYLEILKFVYDEAAIQELKNTGSYNKALLQATLDSK